MFNIFNSNVFIESGEAVGNVKRRLFPRRTHADQMEESFRRYLQSPIHLNLPDREETTGSAGDIVIEGVFTVVEEEEERK